MVFESTLNYYQNDREISEAIAAQLAEVGINVELVVLDQSARQAKLFAGTLGPIWQSGPQYMPTMDAEQALGTLHSDSASNILAVPEVDALLAQARMTFDSAERLGILQDLNALVHEEAPMVFMWQVSQLLASSNEVIGLEFYNTWGFNLMTVDVDR